MNLDIGQGRSRDMANILDAAHIGWGPQKWKHIDVCAAYEPDECYDVTRGIREADGAVQHIWMGDILEHFPRNKLRFVLEECHRVLAPGGELLIVTPDMAGVMAKWLERQGIEDQEGMPLSWLIWGEQDEGHDGANAGPDTHRLGFTEASLRAALLGAGFTSALRVSVHGIWYELAMLARKGD